MSTPEPHLEPDPVGVSELYGWDQVRHTFHAFVRVDGRDAATAERDAALARTRELEEKLRALGIEPG